MSGFSIYPGLLLRCPAMNYEYYAEAGLAEACSSSWFRLAIFLASRPLYEALQKKGFQPGLMDKKQLLSLRKYLNRMCFRPTPFGLFSSFSTLRWNEGSGQVGFSAEAIVVHVRLSRPADRRLGVLLYEKLKSQAHVRVNGSVYRAGNELRYYRSSQDGSSRLLFSLESLQATAVLTGLWKILHQPIPFGEILPWVIKRAACSEDEALTFINDLLERQFLVSEYDPGITGEGYTERLLRACSERGIDDRQVRMLSGIVEGYKAYALRPEAFGRLDDAAGGLLKEHLQDTCYTVMERRPEQGSGLSRQYQEQLLSGLYCLDRLSAPSIKQPRLEQFKQEFLRKFERRVVPFLTALDPQLGIAYGDSNGDTDEGFLETVAFHLPQAGEHAIIWSPVHQLLMRLWKEKDSETGIRITAEDLRDLGPVSEANYPYSFPVLFRIAGNKLLIEQAGGVSASVFSQRFTLFNQSAEEMAEELTALEEQANPGVIFAEIVHYSEDHADNINRRRSVSRYEIPLLCYSERPEEFRIELSDLYLALRQGELILYSARLKKRVIPRLATAYNYLRNDLSLFRFLCDLQYQGIKSALTLDLQIMFPGLTRYPRVEYADTILYPATWCIETSELLRTSHPDDHVLATNFSELGRRHGLPRYFSLNERDRQLVFDSSSVFDLRLLLSSIRPNGRVTLKEFLHHAPGFICDSRGKGYMSQFHAMIVVPGKTYDPIDLPVDKSRVRRTFIPGSPWLYVKIYCYPLQSDQLIAQNLRAVVSALPKKTPWFFIRYADPGYHIRFRVYTGNGGTEAVMKLIEQQFSASVHDGRIERLQVDTYQRELERYSTKLIGDAEAFFMADSELISVWLYRRKDDEPGDGHFLFALYTVSLLLESVLPAGMAITFCRNAVESLLNEYADPKAIRFGLDLRYRATKKRVESVLLNKKYLAAYRLVASSLRVCKVLKIVLRKGRKNDPQKVHRLLADLLHMHLNRIFIRDSRKLELACYHFLSKYLLSAQKRSS
jgi:thiopeptide-type bacteriocin biosynthesis protein